MKMWGAAGAARRGEEGVLRGEYYFDILLVVDEESSSRNDIVYSPKQIN